MEGDDVLLAEKDVKVGPKRDEWMTKLPPERKPGVTTQTTQFSSRTSKDGRAWRNQYVDRYPFRKSSEGKDESLVNGDMWAVAVESAIGKILNAFIVTDHKDSVLLRGCAKEAGYNHLQIVIYDFARPRLSIPNHMLPQTNHPTTISVLHSDNPTVLNVLVDLRYKSHCSEY